VRADAPPPDCSICPRLAAFRRDNRVAYPEFHNAPVPSFGDDDPLLLIVGLAPGLKGANRTARPFTGDYAGDLLYGTLHKFGFARGDYAARADDGLTLQRCRITNAVRCVPPENKPTPAEISACNGFLQAEIAALPRLRALLALGTIAHNAILKALGEKLSAHRFAHGAEHRLKSGLLLCDSYHCSRYNTNTGKLTEAMFHQVFARLAAIVEAQP
jgi:uracil-DNA glycosylase family 4